MPTVREGGRRTGGIPLISRLSAARPTDTICVILGKRSLFGLRGGPLGGSFFDPPKGPRPRESRGKNGGGGSRGGGRFSTLLGRYTRTPLFEKFEISEEKIEKRHFLTPNWPEILYDSRVPEHLLGVLSSYYSRIKWLN